MRHTGAEQPVEHGQRAVAPCVQHRLRDSTLQVGDDALAPKLGQRRGRERAREVEAAEEERQ